MIWNALRSAVFTVLGVAEAVSDIYDRAKRIGCALLPRRREEAFPLTHKDVENIQSQIRRATTIRPPPKG